MKEQPMQRVCHYFKVVGMNGLKEIVDFNVNLTRYPPRLNEFDYVKTRAFKSSLECACETNKKVLQAKKPVKTLVRLVEQAKKVNAFYC